jgi:perosamine synthetase
MTIPIYIPYLSKYKKSAIDAIESEWISNHGIYIEKATNKLRELLDCKYVILMANGTVATHCLFISLKYMYPNINKIYVPNNCYVAVYNCVLMEYELSNMETMHINEETWNIYDDEEYIRNLEPNSAIVIVHNLGGIVNVDKIKSLRPDIILVEDNCEGLFGKYNGAFTGTSVNVLCSSVSFYGNKTITTGEGGAFVTNDEKVYNHIKKMYSQGMSSKRYVHEVHAYNYRMTNIQSAFLYDQLCDIYEILQLKETVFKNYEKLLEPLILSGQIRLQVSTSNTKRANWMFALRIVNNKISIDNIYNYFLNKGVETRPFFYPVNCHKHLEHIKVSEVDIPEMLNSEIIMIPSYPQLTYDEQVYIVKVVNEFINENLI